VKSSQAQSMRRLGTIQTESSQCMVRDESGNKSPPSSMATSIVEGSTHTPRYVHCGRQNCCTLLSADFVGFDLRE